MIGQRLIMRSRRTPCLWRCLTRCREFLLVAWISPHTRLKYWTARSCFWAAARDENVPRFFRFPVFVSFLRE